MVQAPKIRNLLYVNPDPSCNSVFLQLRSAGWELDPVSSLEQIKRLRSTDEFGVGVVRFDAEPTPEWLAMIGSLLARTNAEWVAVMPKEVLANPDARRLIAESFFDFHTLPLDIGRLLTTLGHADGMSALKKKEAGHSHVQVGEEEMVGCCAIMAALFRDIRKVSHADAAVLVTGESGTGKELTAKAIHERSQRAAGPFVAINCAAIPATLIQSELFGYEKGAFTGATQRKIGRLEAAAGGTIFLDEVGDLPLEMQTNLLRFLQEKQVDRIGGKVSIPIDVRVIAATHVDLEKAVATGRFREDLYHRLNVLRIQMPALRERTGDVELLARYFFKQFAHEKRRSLRGFSRDALDAMNRYEWPGNVRELINRVRRAVVMSEGRLLTARDLGLDEVVHGHKVVTLDQAREHAERQTVLSALSRNPNNIARAAKELGVSRVTLYRLIEKHQLRGTYDGSLQPQIRLVSSD
jgi:DNA-binding NtrC family response regulator